MNEMINKEKVIDDLASFIDETDCESETVTISIQLAEAILVLLKNQKARLMTLEEVKEFDWDYCYLEQARLPNIEYTPGMEKNVLRCITWTSISTMRILYGDDCYGKRWRCWSNKPTKEQRQAAEWN